MEPLALRLNEGKDGDLNLETDVDAIQPDGLVTNGADQNPVFPDLPAPLPATSQQVEQHAALDVEVQSDAALRIPQPAASEQPAKHVSPQQHDLVALSDDHYQTLEVMAQRFPDSNIDPVNPKRSGGLPQAEAAQRLVLHGPNSLKPPKKTPKILIFVKQLLNPFLILLEVAALLSFLTYAYSHVGTDLYTAIALTCVCFITSMFSFIQEIKAGGILAKFTKLLTAKCVVYRDGQEQEMDNAANLVVGDIVKVKGGDKVPADLRIIFSQGLKVDNGALTGESRPILLTAAVSPPNTVPTEALCLAWKASACTEGEGLGVVVRTGDQTFIGGIANLTSNSKTKKTPLTIEVESLVLFIAKLAFITGSICFSIAMGRQKGHNVLHNITGSFLVPILGNVPEGLPATVSVLLAITASRMAKRNVLVKKLDCVETLGCTTLICSDKTGTLTKNQMTVTECWFEGRVFSEGFARLFALRPHHHHNQQGQWNSIEVSAKARSRNVSVNSNVSLTSATSATSGASETPCIDDGFSVSPEAVSSKGAAFVSTFELFHRLGTVCNKAFMSPPKGGEVGPVEFVGNASDIAILRFCNELRSASKVRANFPVGFEIPFNSTNKWMLTIAHDAAGESKDGTRQYTVLMKGAPEVILDRCSTHLRRGVEREIDDQFGDEFEEAYEAFGSKGSRVIGVAQRTFTASIDAEFTLESDNFPQDDLCFLGLFSITDPPRDGVKEAIAKCHSAGIKVFMVTGDHHLTAKAIAKQIGILKQTSEEEEANAEHDRYSVILGSDVDALTPQDWIEISKREGVVFARTTPVHKLKIVQNNQAQGHIVAVTGDGVNDAPALKNANIGIAMGISGSEVAREAAAIVLLDDNFASIIIGIEQGRMIFDNLKKTIAYTLTHTATEVSVFILNLLFGLPAPLSTLLLLSIDLGAELGPAISLAYEGPESDIMNRKPRNVKTDRLVSRQLLLYSYLIMGVVVVGAAIIAYFWSFSNAGISPSDLFDTVNSNHWNPTGNDPFCYGPYRNFNVTTANGTVTSSMQTCIGSDEQAMLTARASSAYYMTATLSQGFHVYMCKTRRTSMLHHRWDNYFMFFGSIIQWLLVTVFIYVPGVQVAFLSHDPGYTGWAVLAVNAVVIIAFNEWRKWFIRNHNTHWLARALYW